MSRIADKPTVIPQDVEVKLDGNKVLVKGKNGELSLELRPELFVEIEENSLMVSLKKDFIKRKADEKKYVALRGTFTSLIRNMIIGVTKGFEKHLEIVGIGYRAAMQGSKLILSVGYSNPVEYVAPEGITIQVPAPNKIDIKGIDKYLVGQEASKIRSVRKPNAYSGKGIRYVDEVIIKKEGKKV